MKPKVYLTRLMPPAVMARLESETELAQHNKDRVATRQEIIAGARGSDALFCNILDRVDLDVFEREPRLEAELFHCDKAVLTPHLGSATIGTRTKMGMIAVDNLLAVCAGMCPLNCVNPEVLL